MYILKAKIFGYYVSLQVLHYCIYIMNPLESIGIRFPSLFILERRREIGTKTVAEVSRFLSARKLTSRSILDVVDADGRASVI